MSAQRQSAGEDCLKLTTYFGERDRTPNGLLADELIDIYGAHELQASVLLRGAEGFGRKHHARTDRLLTLSEDLPAVSIAVDSRERIESVLQSVLEIKRRGLITLERARLLSGDIGTVTLPEELTEAMKLTLLGVDGTRSGRRVRARFFAGNAQVPTIVVAVGSGDRIARVLPELGEMLSEPLLTLERVRLCKRDGELLASPHELPGTDEHGLALWQKLTVYTSHAATHEGRPLHMEIIRRLRASGAAGVTALRGVWGFHGEHAPHGDRLLQVRRHVPVVTVAIDTPERTARWFEMIDELTREHGLLTSELVPLARAAASPGR
jgi:PII-like signaling protein